MKVKLSGIKYVQLVKPAIGDQSEQSNFQNCSDTSEGAKVAKKMRDLKRQRREDDQFMYTCDLIMCCDIFCKQSFIRSLRITFEHHDEFCISF